MSRLTTAWRASDYGHSAVGHLAAEIALGPFLHVGWEVFDQHFSIFIHQTSAAEFFAFSSNPLHPSLEHLIIECIHFALIIEVDVIERQSFRNWHAMFSRQFHSSVVRADTAVTRSATHPLGRSASRATRESTPRLAR